MTGLTEMNKSENQLKSIQNEFICNKKKILILINFNCFNCINSYVATTYCLI